MAIRHDFPQIGSEFFGGQCNGLVYNTAFFGTTLQASFEMVKAFLDEQGYEDVLRPKDADELRIFLSPPNNGVQGLFDQPCYSHNPIRISFVRGDRKRRKLVLELFNENAPNSLLRFHKRLDPKQEEELLKSMEVAHFEQYGDLT
ncbi:MAG: hypothetical protein AB8F78_01275 [Saprospiraceae bacterium]